LGRRFFELAALFCLRIRQTADKQNAIQVTTHIQINGNKPT